MSPGFGPNCNQNPSPEARSSAKNGQSSPLVPTADPEAREDIELVNQLRKGNHDALTVLFEKYSGMVFGIARRMLRDDGEAEEVVQRVFLDTYRAIHQFDSAKACYKTWLFQFAY